MKTTDRAKFESRMAGDASRRLPLREGDDSFMCSEFIPVSDAITTPADQLRIEKNTRRTYPFGAQFF
ncbi:MAG: hypothetical protein KDL09_02460 [Prosthecobacter sp.]|nr:hypothetical protein [Prosthecobacter sp.]